MAYKVMIVDDSSIVRKVIVRTIGMTDLKIDSIVEAENGKQALEKLREAWVDLVFLDINMPVMNGMEFMEQLRCDDVLKDTPVIVVSTEGSRERIDRLASLGVKVYLRKPVTPESLTEAVETVFAELASKEA